MSTMFTCVALFLGAYVATKVLDGAGDDDPIIISRTRSSDGHEANPRAGKRRRDIRNDAEADRDDDGKRKLKFPDNFGGHDINGNVWPLMSKDDAKIFHPAKGGEGGLVRVMRRERVGKFISRAFSSSPTKEQSLVHFLDDVHDQIDSSSLADRGGSEYEIMPQQFGAMWPIIRRMLGAESDEGNGALECLFLAKYAAGNLNKVPLLMCAPRGTTVPHALQKGNWLTANSVVGNLPPRYPETRQFLGNCANNLESFMTVCWDEEFEGSLAPFLDALSGKDALAAKNMKEMSDMFILLMFHVVFAKWATAMWTQFKNQDISPGEAAERLREDMQEIIGDLRDNRWEPYPHISTFGPDGRLQTLVSATNAENRRLELAERSNGGVGKQATHQPNMGVVPVGTKGAVGDAPPPSQLPLKQGGRVPKSDRQAVAPGEHEERAGGGRKKGLCIACIMRLMSVKEAKACTADERWTHPVSLTDVTRTDIKNTLSKLHKSSESRVEAEKWLAKNMKAEL